MRPILIAFLVFGGLLLQDATTAQDKPPPPKTDLGFDASKVPPPDPKKGQPVARVLDQYVYPDQIGLQSPVTDKDKLLRLQYFIFGPLFDRVQEREKLAATREEIAQLEAFLKKRRIDSVAALTHLWFYRVLTGNKGPGQDRIDAIVLWKIERALYQRYGGTVALSKFRSPMPVEAYRRFLNDAQRAGAVEIYDKKIRAALVEQLQQKPRFVVPPEEVDFDTPGWVPTDSEKSM